MLKKWGWLGLVLILFCEFNFIYKIQPFALWYFPIIWFGYILFVDSIVFKIKHKSLITTNISKLIGMFLISPLVWWIFEFMNIALKNWQYTGTESLGIYYHLFATLSFSVVIPAFFETFDLIKAFFKFEEKEPKIKTSRKTAFKLIVLGIILLILTLTLPYYFFPFAWISIFLIIDPINSLRNQPNLIDKLKNKNYKIFLICAIAMLMMGFFWEFWNYWAVIKWVYFIPFFNFWHFFEMPLLGYLGYIPFSFEIYAIYYFIRGCFR